MRPLEHYLALIKQKLWSINCKWIGSSICVWKQSSYRELNGLINVSTASLPHSWSCDADFHLASRWSIRSNKDHVDCQKMKQAQWLKLPGKPLPLWESTGSSSSLVPIPGNTQREGTSGTLQLWEALRKEGQSLIYKPSISRWSCGS